MSYKSTSRTKKGQVVDRLHPFFTQTVRYSDDVICVDEASYVSCDTPRKGWSKRGSSIHKHPPKRRRVVSLLLAIDRSGVVQHEIRAGSFDQHSFSRFLERLPQCKTILLDNVSLHKTALVRRTASERGQQLRFTPPYCPWFNPTEYAFSVSKRVFRRLRGLRQQGAGYFEDDIRASLDTVTADKCRAFFDHSSRLVQSADEA